LPETEAQKNGLIDRERLLDIYGRSRKPQMKLAEEFGLTDYPNPAGGCLLTEPNYAWRLKELLKENPDPSLKELHLLRAGRHFRMGGIKIIAGRNEADNNRIESLADREDALLRAEGCGSPLVLVTGAGFGQEEIEGAAAICARYSDNRHLPMVEITIQTNGTARTVMAAPASEEFIETHRVKKPVKQKKNKKA
ncbi:MAG: hypothetical protein M0Z75_12885, partial [Nitrospiraceae bacterium]|nr:hypothetical protein [Nitrospiraceae bacterium]